MRVFLTFLFLVAVSGGCFTGAAHAGPASSDKRRAVRVKVTRYASDDSVDVVARVRTATPHRPCYGRVFLKGRSQRLSKRLTTGKFDGGKWRWELVHHAPGGRLTLKVRCIFADGIPHRATGHRNVPASIHASPRFRRIVARGTLRTAKWKPPPGPGVGGGGSLYPSHRCTWWVARLRPDLPFFPGYSGDALNWFDAARRRGFPTGTMPRVGSVAVFAPGQYGAGEFGHVAYVKEVSGYTITISEANFKHTRDGHERTIKWEGLRFIYHKGETEPDGPESPIFSNEYSCPLGENPQRFYLRKQTAPHYMSQSFTAKGHWITGGTLFTASEFGRSDTSTTIGVYRQSAPSPDSAIAEATITLPAQPSYVTYQFSPKVRVSPADTVWLAVSAPSSDGDTTGNGGTTAGDGTTVYRNDPSVPPGDQCLIATVDGEK